MTDLFIDFETYSSVDLTKTGVYPYVNSPDFEPLMLAYSIDNQKTYVEDLIFTNGEFPHVLLKALETPTVKIHAHNANFERLVLKTMGFDIPIKRFECSAVKASYCGLPLSLDAAAKALGLELEKDSTGKSLIRFFSMPCKPTKANGFRSRNLKHHDLEKWNLFLEYCRRDVEVEKELVYKLNQYEFPKDEKKYYITDQKINDTGVLIDANLVRNAIRLDSIVTKTLKGKLKEITGLTNPNSPLQLSQWLSEKLQKNINSVAKNVLIELRKEHNDSAVIRDVLDLKLKSAKSSVKKYKRAEFFKNEDGRVRGLFAFYGAGRTGRWAGRGVQVQNLPRNYIDQLTLARDTVKRGDLDTLQMLYNDPKDILSQLIRTMFIPKDGHIFLVADYSAIEARVVAWLAGENWRLDVFRTHGKIYEASAAMMFNVPIESVTKDSEYRRRAKVAELALGYQGALGALIAMGGEKMGLSESEMKNIVKLWRAKSPNIVKFWKTIQNKCIYAIKNPNNVIKMGAFAFLFDGDFFTITLPSGRQLFYKEATIVEKDFYGKKQYTFKYRGLIQDSGVWGWVHTYGGKLTENVVQAVARDLLAFAIEKLTENGFNVVMHVHDEVVIEAGKRDAFERLESAIKIMCINPKWADGLPLGADGFITEYYKKD